MKKMIALLSGWRHSGFYVFCGKRILPKEETALETLARYIIRTSFSQERMQYIDQEGTVIYSVKRRQRSEGLRRPRKARNHVLGCSERGG
jgi:hypothetical protein